MQLKNGATIANRYVVSGILGTGGMAIVYRAKDIKLDRDVTLKVMREEFSSDDEFINRFNVEAKAAAKLTHQNIVNVYDVGKHGDVYYIVMEYIDGVTLKDIITTKGAFNNEELLGVAIQIASALEVAHRNNIVHRDIKPQNILVTVKGEIKVTDFGIARAVNANTVTAGNNTMGSVHYFSPEQARGGYIDQKSDIYSLGITMYEMATGEIPFDDENAVAIALKHISDELPDITEKNPNIVSSVVNIILKATQKVSSLRFDSMEAMNNELKRALTNINNKEQVPEGEVVNISVDKSATILLSDSDVEEIRSRAMTAFFDDKDMEELANGLLYNENQIYDDVDEEIDEEGKSDKLFIIAGFVTAIMLIIIIGIILVSYIKSKAPNIVTVPNLAGKTLVEARADTSDLGIEIIEAKQSFSDTVPKGKIIVQDYESIEVGGTVKVEVSLGTDKIEIPNKVGVDIDEAIESFDKLGFKIEEKYIFDKNVDLNKVISQSPNGGTYGYNGDTITLYISKGKESMMIVVPSLRGLSVESAKTKLEAAGLEYGGSTSDYSSAYEEGLIIAQSPNAGMEVANGGGTVSVVLSRGEKPVEEKPVEEGQTNNTETTTTTSPEPSPAPKDSETPEPSPPPQPKTAQIRIKAPDGAEVDEEVTFQLVQVSKVDGSKLVIHEDTKKAGDLPISINVSGTGSYEYELFVIENGVSRLIASQTIDFSSME